MSTSSISVEQFQELLDRLGEDLSAWPEELRNQALELLSTSEDARKRLAEAKATADELRATSPKAPKGLVNRILRKAGLPPDRKP